MKFFKTKIHTSIERKRCEMHSCLRHAMRLARWSGVFPVEGLGYSTPSEIRYKLKSVYGLYFFSFLLGQTILLAFNSLWHVKNEANLGSVAMLILYATSLTSTILFLKLAKRWSKLMKTAAEIEDTLNVIGITKHVALKTSVISYGVMFLALVEHILYFNCKITIIMYCLHQGGSTSHVIERHFRSRFPFVFDYLPYNISTGLLVTWFTLQAKFLLSFTDLLIICFSIYITDYFKNINNTVAMGCGRRSTNWGELRAHYSQFVMLVQDINDHIGGFLLMSSFSDLFYICMQLCYSMQRSYHEFAKCSSTEISLASSSPSYLLYYLYSFLFLVLRTLLMFKKAANVHTAARMPLVALYDVPASAHDMEVIRFQFQIRYTTVGLCGYFFYVTRNMILKVIANIITYELVLLQISRSADYPNSLMIDNEVVNVTNAAIT